MNPMLYLDSKSVRKKVRAYIRRCTIGYPWSAIHNKFNWEKRDEIVRVGRLKACENWLRGLGINVDYMPHDIAPLMAYWFGGTKEEWFEWLDENGDDIYWRTLARGMLSM